MTTVTELRRSFIEQRKQLSPEEVASRSCRIRENLVRFCEGRWALEVWDKSLIASYRVGEGNPFREVDPAGLPELPYFQHANFAYPRIRSLADGLLDFSFASQPSDWKLGPFGLWEPRPELGSVHPKDLGLVLCPGVVFDEMGGRVGMGKGFYDRFLVTAPGAFRVGLAYDFQVVKEAIELKPHDQKLDALVTETRVLTFDA